MFIFFSMISFAFIEDYRSKFTWIHNHVIIKQIIAITISDSRIRFSIVLAKLERVLLSTNLWAKATNVKWRNPLKKMLNIIAPAIDPYGTTDIICGISWYCFDDKILPICNFRIFLFARISAHGMQNFENNFGLFERSKAW